MNRSLLYFTCLLLTACGGGTAGTSPTESGFGKIFQGSVVDETGAPVDDASVSIEDTSTMARTDSFGRFQFESEITSRNATLHIAKDYRTTEVQLSDLAPDTGVVGLRVELGRGSAESSHVELVVRSIGGGLCEGAFGAPHILTFATSAPPLLVIEQQKQLPLGTRCTVEVGVSEQGRDSGGIGFHMLYVDLATSSSLTNQRVVAEGQTDSLGSGSLSFTLGRDIATGGYLVLEAPTDLPSSDRVGVVVSLLIGEI
ncbi:MAG: carboxypeptidase-like regulatory domain-containing protein [Bdellovibrionota bacterium]